MRFLILLFLASCGGKVSDYLVQTPGGGVYVKEILTDKNLITCKKVAYCKASKEAEWKECKSEKEAKDAHRTYLEVACIDLIEGSDFILSLKQWEKVRHKFGEYMNEHIFELLDDRRYVKEKTELFDGKAPQMEEDFKEFHFKRREEK